MSRIDVIKNRMAAANKMMGETVTYNGMEIKAIPEIGATLDKNTGIEAAALADLAIFTISANDVPNPAPGNTIIYNNETYKVRRIQLVDSAGGLYVLEAVANSRGYKK